MRTITSMLKISISLILIAATSMATAHETAGPSAKLVLEDLVTQKLEMTNNTEVIVSKVRIPANTTLPKHWHPGEEFAYMLEGSVTLWQKGKPDVVFRKGDVGTVPLKQVHTVTTHDEGATILVFRVHETGQPGRILVDK